MKGRNKKNKAILIVALILCITIGYAVLSTTLNITGNSEIKNAKWDIHFDNLVVDSSSVEATTPAVIDSNKTTINYGVYLASPGDSYSFTVDVVNEGTIDGMISTVTNTGLTEEQQKYIEYTATYTNGKELKEKDGLKVGATKNIKVSIKYKDDINPEDLPKEEKTIDLTFRVEYVQADDTVTPPATPIMKSYASSSIDDYHNSTYRSKITKIVTKTNTNVPETAIEQWDVSAAGDGSVIAYVEDDGSGTGKYQVTIGGDGGKIIANEDSSNLFYSFTSLKEVDFSNLNTSNVTTMSYMFNACSSLTSLDLNNWDMSKVTNVASMFRYCSSLTNLDLSKWNISRVTNIGGMFYNCTSLNNLNLSQWNTSRVTNMTQLFYNCSSLTNLDLNNWNTSRVTNMIQLFYNCSSLTSLDLNNWNTSKVTMMQGVFYGCSSLISLNIGNWDTSNVVAMGDLKVGSTWYIGGGMFCGCTNLQNMDLSKWNTSKVQSMNQAFSGCSNLSTTIRIMNENTEVLDDRGMSNHIFYGAATAENAKIEVIVDSLSLYNSLKVDYYDGNIIIKYTGDPADIDVEINYDKFKSCFYEGREVLNISFNYGDIDESQYTIIDTIDISKSGDNSIVAYIMERQDMNDGYNNYVDVAVYSENNIFAPTDCSSLFSNLSYLQNITFDNFNTSNVTNMNSMFYGCTNLSTTIKIMNEDIQYNHGDMFSNAATAENTKIEVIVDSLSLYNSLKEDYYDGNIIIKYTGSGGLGEEINAEMLKSCYSSYGREVLNISFNYGVINEYEYSIIDRIDLSASGNNSIVAYVIDRYDVTDEYGNNYIEIAVYSENSIAAPTDCSSLFSNLRYLQDITFDNFNTSNVINMDSMFSDCNNLTSLDLSRLDTSNVEMMNNMFMNCSNLTNLVFNVMNGGMHFNLYDIGLDTSYNRGIVLNYTYDTEGMVYDQVSMIGDEEIVRLGMLVDSDSLNNYESAGISLAMSNENLVKSTLNSTLSDGGVSSTLTDIGGIVLNSVTDTVKESE